MEDGIFNLMIGSTARGLATGIAGALIAAGAVQSSGEAQVVQIISGILVWGATQVWSYFKNKQHAADKAVLTTAIETQTVPSVTNVIKGGHP